MPDNSFLTTIDLLDMVRARLKSLNRNDSDYEAAKVLGVSQPTTSAWRTGKQRMGEDAGLAAAEFLGLEQEYVMACLLFERAQSDKSRNFWRDLAAKLSTRRDVAVIAAASVFTVYAALPYLLA